MQNIKAILLRAVAVYVIAAVTSIRPKCPNFILSLSYRFDASGRRAASTGKPASVSSDSLFEGKEF